MDQALLELAIKYFPYLLFALGTLAVALIVFSIQLMRFGPDIRRLNKIETIAQLASFARDQQDMTVAFGKATNASDRMQSAADNALKDLESLKEYVADLQEKMSEYNAPQIMQARLDLEDTQPKRGVLWQRNAAAPAQARSPDDLYSNMRLEWSKFQEVFKQRLIDSGIEPNMTRIGKMTYMLSDRRRANPLPVETANLIAALQSQYKRYVALQKLTFPEHDNFVQLVKTAINELQRQSARSENGYARNNNDMPPSIQNTRSAIL